jgi:hypothetical protein
MSRARAIPVTGCCNPSRGSRFETGMLIPTPVAILVKLYVKGTLSDTDLLEQ